MKCQLLSGSRTPSLAEQSVFYHISSERQPALQTRKEGGAGDVGKRREDRDNHSPAAERARVGDMFLICLLV